MYNGIMTPPKVNSFTDLTAWQKSHQLALQIYKLTIKFPESEKFGLSNQLRRAAVAITSNIAEGFYRSGRKEKRQFYSIALGSVGEVQSQILIARDIKYIDENEFNKTAELSITVHKLINGLIKSVSNRPN